MVVVVVRVRVASVQAGDHTLPPPYRYIHTYTHMHTYIHTYIHIYVRTYRFLNRQTNKQTYIHTYIHRGKGAVRLSRRCGSSDDKGG